jgi:hypothetical protein
MHCIFNSLRVRIWCVNSGFTPHVCTQCTNALCHAISLTCHFHSVIVSAKLFALFTVVPSTAEFLATITLAFILLIPAYFALSVPFPAHGLHPRSAADIVVVGIFGTVNCLLGHEESFHMLTRNSHPSSVPNAWRSSSLFTGPLHVLTWDSRPGSVPNMSPLTGFV